MQYNMSGEQRPLDLREGVQSKAVLVSRIFKVLSWVAVGVGSFLTVLFAMGVGSVANPSGGVGAALLTVILGALYTFAGWLNFTLLHVLSGYVAVRLAEGAGRTELVAH